ncbi:MAG: type II secretion system minor pseudopilin GspI [Burkholderiales bacterium]
MSRRWRNSTAGFTLVEAVVALAIISIALMSALRVAGQSAANVGVLRERLLAGWVAENSLAEHRARGDWLAPGIYRGRQREGGLEFAWREEVIATPNPAFRRIDTFVSAPSDETHALAHFTAMLVDPAAIAR